MTIQFKRAEKKGLKLRMALLGPTGSGKTYTAESIARPLLKPGQRIGHICTENHSAEKYADIFDFDVLNIDAPFGTEKYIDALKASAEAGHGVTIVDSLSHAWAGPGGILDYVDSVTARKQDKNSYTSWRQGTAVQNKLIDALLTHPTHLIVTMRTKMEYVQEKDERGKTVVRKVGMQPVQRADLEYEFDVIGDLDHENNLVVSKSRCHVLSGKVFQKPGADFAKPLLEWLESGVKMASVDKVQEVRDLVSKVGVTESAALKTLGVETWVQLTDQQADEAIQRLQARLSSASRSGSDTNNVTTEVNPGA